MYVIPYFTIPLTQIILNSDFLNINWESFFTIKFKMVSQAQLKSIESRLHTKKEKMSSFAPKMETLFPKLSK